MQDDARVASAYTLCDRLPCAAFAAPLPTDDSIRALLTETNPNMDIIDYKRVYAGPLGVHKEGVAVVEYNLVIKGGNAQDPTFGIFTVEDGKTALHPNRPELGEGSRPSP
jgi:hypothetical protein